MSLPIWKQKEQKKRSQKQKKTVILFLLFSFLTLISALIFRIYLGYRQSEIRKISRINLLINSRPKVFLLSLEGKKLLNLSLPDNKKIKLVKGYGDYEIGKIYRLGEIEERGSDLLLESIQNFLAVPIFKVIDLDGEEGMIFDLSLASLKDRFSFFDSLYLWWRFKNVSRKDISYLDLNGSGFYKEDESFDEAQLDLFLGKYFFDQKIVDEDLTIAVFNATPIQGLGFSAARILINLGSRVVNIGNSESMEECLLRSTKGKLNTYTLKRINLIFGCRWEEGEVESGRADIGLYLGNQYWKKMTEKW